MISVKLNLNSKNICIGYLGPEGTFTEQALRNEINDPNLKLTPYLAIKDVIEAVARREVNLGYVPLENSIEGTVNETLDLLLQNSSIRIVKESVMPIKHNLITLEGVRLDQIQELYSHPQAIAQCRNTLYKLVPQTKIVFTSSTSQAIDIVRKKGGNLAAVGNGSILPEGMEIKVSDLQDYPNNETRFILIQNNNEKLKHYTECSERKFKTSIGFTLPDKPGSLYEVLKVFADNKVNLQKIESRPTKNRLGEYIFFINIEGTEENNTIRKSLINLEKITESFRNLGSYAYDERRQ